MFQSNEKFNYGIHHGLRGSVSPVLMATQLALSMGNSKIWPLCWSEIHVS